MKANGKNAVLWPAAIAAVAIGVIAAAGIYASGQKQADGSVLESAKRTGISSRTSQPAVNPAPAPIDYVASLPEPMAEQKEVSAQPAKTLPQPQISATDPRPSFLPEQIAKAGGGDCSAGSRPMGDCNCYNEAAGKISLRIHPSESCVDEESKRLGHRILVASDNGGLELAGHDGVPQPLPESFKPKIAEAAPVQFNPDVTQVMPANPAAVDPLRAGRYGQIASTSTRFSRRPATTATLAAAARGNSTASEVGRILAMDHAQSQCPAGSKNEYCRCASNQQVGNGRAPFIRSFSPIANAPSYCSDPEIASQRDNPNESAYLKILYGVVTRYTSTAKR